MSFRKRHCVLHFPFVCLILFWYISILFNVFCFKTSFTVMPLRYVRFYLFAHLTLLRAYPTPSTAGWLPWLVRVSHVHALPLFARNKIPTPDSPRLPLSVNVDKVADFIFSGRLITINSLTKPYFCSLQIHRSWALHVSFPPHASRWLQPERIIGLIVTSIQLGI